MKRLSVISLSSENTVQRKTFEGENSCEFCSFMAIYESFLHKVWGHGILWNGKSKQSAKVFSVKIVLFTNSQKFSPLKVSRYTVLGTVRDESIDIFAVLYMLITTLSICESFLHEIWGHDVFWHGTSEQTAKVFSAKIVFFHQFVKLFSLESFPLYNNFSMFNKLLSKLKLVTDIYITSLFSYFVCHNLHLIHNLTFLVT